MIPSLWARYKAEICEVKFLEKEFGFVGYSILDKVLHIEDVYVIPEMRSVSVTRDLLEEMEQIGRTSGCETFIGHVDVVGKTAAASLQWQLHLGFVPFSAENGRIWLKRAIAQGE